jgi:hypothetical protein
MRGPQFFFLKGLMKYKVEATILQANGNTHQQGAILEADAFDGAEDIVRRLEQGGISEVEDEKPAKAAAPAKPAK